MTEFNLTQSDLESFERCYLRECDLLDAGIHRVDHLTGMHMVGGRSGTKYSGWVAPNYWPGNPSPRSYTLRLDEPPLEMKNDGTIKEKQKYRNELGRSNLLYIPPRTPAEWLADASIEIYITEGPKKTLALWRMVRQRRHPVLCIGLAGVWNWRGLVCITTDAKGARREVRGPIPDLDKINWDRRTVRIIFDSNAIDNKSVSGARSALSKELKDRGAKVILVNLPQMD